MNNSGIIGQFPGIKMAYILGEKMANKMVKS